MNRSLRRRPPVPLARALAFVLAAGCAAPAMLGAAEGDKTVARILVEGNHRLPDETVLSWLSVQPGDPYDPAAMRDEFRSLWRREVFSDISIESRRTPEGIVLIFHVREKPVISNVTYKGLKAVPVDQLEDTLKQVNASLPIGAPVSQSRIQKAREVIRQLLAEAGRRSAEIDFELIAISLTQQEIRFLIVEGPKTKIKKVLFSGNKVLKSKQLRDVLRWTQGSTWWKIFSRKDVLHENRLRDDLQQVSRLYESRGYLDIKVQDYQIEPVGGDKKPPPAGDKKKKKKPKKEWIRITIPVVEGTQYRLGSLRVRGNRLLSNEEVLGRIPLRQGEVFNDSALDIGLSRLELAYGEHGYFYMTTNKVLERQPDRTANVLIEIEEDEQYTINRLEFRGNTTTRDAVLRREFRLHEEDLFDISQFRTGLRRVNQLGYWQIAEEPVIRPNRDDRTVDILISGREESRNEIQIGGGVSGVDGAFFSGSYSTSNFLGRGEIFQAFLQAGGRRDLFNFSFIEPYFMGTDFTLGFNVFQRQTDFIDFRQSGTGASLQFGRRLRHFNFARFDTTYLFENITVQDPPFPDQDSTTSSITPSFTVNSFNNIFRPTRGHRFRVSSEFAGGFLGGDNFFIKPIVQSTLYLPALRKTYIGVNAEVGWVEPYGTRNGFDRVVPSFERFYLGGERSMRAFESRSVSPVRNTTIPPTDIDGDGDLRDEDLNGNGLLDTEDINRNTVLDPGEDLNGNGILDTEDTDGDGTLDLFLAGGTFTSFPGGNKFMLFNGEFVIPMGDTVEVGFFIDAGNAFDDDQSFDIGNLRVDYGIEARFYLPVFQAPLRLFYGIIYDPRPGEDDSNFQFSIGRTF